MRIPLDRTSPEPLYRQIQYFLRDQIQTTKLTPEMRLPSSRDLSASLGVSRITVTNAYAELEAEGLVYTRPGSGIYVAPRMAALPKSRTDMFSTGDWPLWQQELLSRTWLPAQRELDALTATVKDVDLISFAPGMGAVDLFPADEFRKTLQHVLRRDSKKAFAYGDRNGYPPLRKTIAHILTNQGVPTSPDNVLITTGSQQAIALVAHLILHPGNVVLVESPTYLGAIDLFRSMDVRVLGMPMDEHGMIIDSLEEALATARPRLIYTIPTFQNPTGVCLSTARRRQLIAIAARFNIPILEDDCFGDLRYDGRTQPALKALDPSGQVIYINTFSKMLMPGLRIGYMVASGPVYDRLSACKRAIDLSTCNPIQRALEAYVSVGRYSAFLRKACRLYRRRRNAMLAALERYLPAGVSWQTPQGGLFLWLQLPEGCSANDLFPFAAEEGVTYAPGSIFFPGERVQPYLRLNFVINPPETIETGIRRLGLAIDRYLTSDLAPNMRPQRQRNITV